MGVYNFLFVFFIPYFIVLIKYNPSHFFWMSDCSHNKIRIVLARCLYFDIPEVEKGWNKTSNIYSHILYFVKA